MIALVCIAALATPQETAAARGMSGFRSVAVSDGPLLFFTRPENEAGEAWCVGYERAAETVYVFDPASTRAPQVIRAQPTRESRLYPHFLARLTSELALVEHSKRLGLLELHTGKWSGLLESDAATTLLEVRGSSVYFLESRRQEPNVQWLYVHDACASDGARRLTTLQFESAIPNHPSLVFEKPHRSVGRSRWTPPSDERGFLLITAAPDRRIVRVSREGVAAELMKFDERWDSDVVQVHESPDRRFMAIVGMRHGEWYGARDLVVVDTTPGGAVVSYRDALPAWTLPPSVPRGGNPDHLHVVWGGPGDKRSAWPGTAVLDSMTGHVLEQKETPLPTETSDQPISTGPIELNWDELNREPAGPYFDVSIGAVFYRGEKSPIRGSRRVDTKLLEPSGHWASFVLAEPWALQVLNAERREFRDVITGWVYDVHWIGASAP